MQEILVIGGWKEHKSDACFFSVPEASPRDVRCTALSSDKLQVSWQPPPESLVHGVIQGYRLLYEPVPLPVLTSDRHGVLCLIHPFSI